MRVRRLVLAGTAAVLLAGCSTTVVEGAGSPAPEAGPASDDLVDMSGPEVADAAASALEEAGAFHVQGSGSDGGQELAIDLHLQDGDAMGTLTMAGFPIQIISVGGAAYLQAPVAFWEMVGAPAEEAGMFEGVWVMASPAEAAMFGELSIAGLAAELRGPTDSPIVHRVRPDERDGEPVVVVKQENGSTMTVAASGPPYPLVTEDGGPAGGSGTMTFSRFGERVPITPPADVFDPSEFGG